MQMVSFIKTAPDQSFCEVGLDGGEGVTGILGYINY